MAWIQWSGKNAYIYERVNGEPKLMEALGVIGKREAEAERIRWIADNEKTVTNAPNRSMQSLYDEYIDYLKSNEYAETTIEGMKYSVLPLIGSVKVLRELTPARIEVWDQVLQKWRYRRSPREDAPTFPLSKEGRARKLRDISAFCGWLKEKGYVKESPFKVKIPAQREDAGRALFPHQVRALFANWPLILPRRGAKWACLSKLFFQIKYAGGTRLSELLGYSDKHPGAIHENLDRERCILKLEKTKAGKQREVALPRHVVDAIPQGTGPIFWQKISSRCLADHLGIAMTAAGITGRLRIHDARVTSATEWARKNRDTKSSMDQFGWKTAKIAMHYDKVATDRRVEQAQNMTYE